MCGGHAQEKQSWISLRKVAAEGRLQTLANDRIPPRGKRTLAAFLAGAAFLATFLGAVVFLIGAIAAVLLGGCAGAGGGGEARVDGGQRGRTRLALGRTQSRPAPQSSKDSWLAGR